MKRMTLESAAATVHACLAQLRVEELLVHMRRTRGVSRPLVAVHEDTPLDEVLATMRDEGIHAVPVFRTLAGRPDDRLFRGIVSVFDILSATICQRMFDGMADADHVLSMSKQEFARHLKTLEAERAFFATKIGSLIGTTRESAEAKILHSTSPLTTLLRLFTSTRCHRTLVLDDDEVIATACSSDEAFRAAPVAAGSALRIVSQTDVVEFLLNPSVWASIRLAAQSPAEFDAALEHILALPVSAAEELAVGRLPARDADANQPLDAKTGKPRRHVVSVHSGVSALAALRCMFVHRVQSVAVTDDSGRLAASISAADLRGITADNLETLVSPVFDFLEAERRTPAQLKPDQLRTALPDTHVGVAAGRMLESRVHRLWIVNSHDKLVSVVSMTDVLALLEPAAA
ncbi:hypothetical protein HK105_204876 [Polyrhizophydium stewartii]|uniref:CBS domain-containing protein n=1 Tax=Polyrhizophydium stewartii TaxID=2732419 RepID=A0ABR4N8A5_9FUNG